MTMTKSRDTVVSNNAVQWAIARCQLRLVRDWKMLADVGRQLVFPPEIATTTLRLELMLWSPSLKKIYIIKLTVPSEDTVNEVYQLKNTHCAEAAV